MKRPDETYNLLVQLNVPPARDSHREAILAAAAAHPRRSPGWFDMLRQLRAHLYVPQMRYAIMAGVVGFFILVGLVANPPVSQTQDTQLAANELLDDIEFSEEEWGDDWMFAGGY